MDTYKIVRFLYNGTRIVLLKGFSEEGAMRFCQSPETSSRSCLSKIAQVQTVLLGPWFDYYLPE